MSEYFSVRCEKVIKNNLGGNLIVSPTQHLLKNSRLDFLHPSAVWYTLQQVVLAVDDLTEKFSPYKLKTEFGLTVQILSITKKKTLIIFLMIVKNIFDMFKHLVPGI